jgi:hypothetical protein
VSYTPGPWEYDGKFQVCIPHEKGLTCFRTNPEDARLIAAAPELLEALRKFVDGAEDERTPTPALCAQARAAIAKAEGRS